MRKLTIILTFIVSTTTFGQNVDSSGYSSASTPIETLTTTTDNDPYEGTDDFSPMQLAFILVLLSLILLGIGAGIVLTVLALLLVFGLVSFGILSTSIIIGLNKKSFSKGFKTFIILTSTISGLLAGGTSFWLFNKIVHWWTTQTAILTGMTCGLLAGLGFGFLAIYILQRLSTYFKAKLNDR